MTAPRYFESMAELFYRISTGGPKSRPTVYRGIEFRSRLEARYARHLDALGEAWRYEPRIYGGSYLPDFEIQTANRPTFIELKPTIAEAPDAQRKAAVIWKTHPNALLLIACEEGATYFGALRGGPWETWQERWSA